MSRTTEHKEGQATVKMIYYTQKTLTDGTHPFLVRITKNRKRKFVSTGLSLHPQYWNPAKGGEIRRSYPDKERRNLLYELDQWEGRYQAAARQLSEEGIPHEATDVASVVSTVRKQGGGTLIAYMDQVIAHLRAGNQGGTADVYRTVRNRINTYLEGKDVPLKLVNVKFCNDFERWMRRNGIADITMHNRFSVLRAVLNIAIAEGDLGPETYPFTRSAAERHKFSLAKFDMETEKRAITREQIIAIENYIPVGTHEGRYATWQNQHEVEWLHRAKSVFLFSYYVGGINYTDLIGLRWGDLEADPDTGTLRARYTRQKTHSKLLFLLIEPALAIIDQYRAGRDIDPAQYIFPFLDRHKHLTPKQIQTRRKDTLDRINEHLKTIGTACKLPIELTTYVARHSFATGLRRAGVADAVTSQLLGHATEKQTTTYLDAFGSSTTDAAVNALIANPVNLTPNDSK